MKKLVFGLCALFMCFMFASCGGSPTDKIKSLTKEIEKNGNDWTDPDQWDEVIKEGFNCIIEFVESDPSDKEFEEFLEVATDFESSMKEGIDDDKAKKAMYKARKKHKGLRRDAENAVKKKLKSIKKNEKDDDDSGDDEDEDEDDE